MINIGKWLKILNKRNHVIQDTNFKMIRSLSPKYGVQEISKKHYILNRFIREYDNFEEAAQDQFNLVKGNTTEEEVINKEKRR